jgi:hypothetical protein
MLPLVFRVIRSSELIVHTKPILQRNILPPSSRLKWGWWCIFLQILYLPTNSHSITTHKNNVVIFTTAEISNLI